MDSLHRGPHGSQPHHRIHMKRFFDFVLLRNVTELFYICGIVLFWASILAMLAFEVISGTHPKFIEYFIAAPFIYAATAAIYCTASGRGYLLNSDASSRIAKINDQLAKLDVDEYRAIVMMRTIRDRVPKDRLDRLDELLRLRPWDGA
jgi:hypothetical protein